MKIIDKKNNIVYIQGKDIKLLIEIKNMIPKQLSMMFLLKFKIKNFLYLSARQAAASLQF